MCFRAATGLGFHLQITMDVQDVSVEQRRLRLLVNLPFGITNDQTTTLTDAGAGRTLVRFG